MKPSRESIFASAIQLPESDRVELVEQLLDSIHGPSDPVVDAAWAKEAERRIADVDSGKTKAIPAEEVARSVRPRKRR